MKRVPGRLSGAVRSARRAPLRFRLACALVLMLAAAVSAAAQTGSDTTITSGPPAVTSERQATFTFTSTEGGSTFECGLARGDGADATAPAGWAACTSPYTTTELPDDVHTFFVRATDPAGNTDPTPASYRWTIDSGEIDTSVSSGPNGLTNDPTPTFNFDSTVAGAAFECRVVSNPAPSSLPSFGRCEPPYTVPDPGLASGRYTIQARSVTPEGTADPTPAKRSFEVDTTPPPAPTITDGPAEGAIVNARSATFKFSSAEAGATFECRMDNYSIDDSADPSPGVEAAAFEACAGGGETFDDLRGGPHKLEVRAIDGANNASPVTTRNFVVDVCETKIEFGLVQALGKWCFEDGAWVAEPGSDPRINGIKLTALSGGNFGRLAITPPSGGSPGKIQLKGIHLVLRNPVDASKSITLYQGNLSYDLPSDDGSGRGRLFTLSKNDISPSATLFGLPFDASIAVELVKYSDGDYGTEFQASLALPDVFNDGSGGGVSGDVTVKVTNKTEGMKLDSFKVQTTGPIYLGTVQIATFCLSYRSGTSAATTCQGSAPLPAALAGCNEATAGARWDGYIKVVLPTPTNASVEAAGGTVDGRFSYGYLAGRNFNLPLGPNITLTDLGFGICIERRNDGSVKATTVVADPIGLSIEPQVKINGSLAFSIGQEVYDDRIRGCQNGTKPGSTRFFSGWYFKVEASASVFGVGLACAYVHWFNYGALDFGARVGLTLKSTVKEKLIDKDVNGDGDKDDKLPVDLISVGGQIDGNIWFQEKQFNLEGSVAVKLLQNIDVQILGVTAFYLGAGSGASISGLVSNIGVAACGQITRIKKNGETKSFGLGAGLKWSSAEVEFLEDSCDMGAYRATGSRVSASSTAQQVRVGNVPAALLAVQGEGGLPAVTLTAPDGERIPAPWGPEDDARLRKRYGVVQHALEDTTYVVLTQPSAGRWRIEPQPGSVPIKRIRQADGMWPTDVDARVEGSGYKRTIHYRILDGEPTDKVTFAEKGTYTSRPLGVARGRSGTIPFTPGDGRAERRSIVAHVERDGLLVDKTTVASYQAPPRRMPAKPRGLQVRRVVRRGRGYLDIRWGHVAPARDYAVAVRLADGRTRTFTRPQGDRHVMVRDVSAHLGARILVRGRLPDGVPGPISRASSRPRPLVALRRGAFGLRSASRTLNVPVTCSRHAFRRCVGTLRLKSGRRALSSQGGFSIRPGRRHTVRLQLTRRGQALVRRLIRVGRRRVAIEIQAGDDGAHEQRGRRTLSCTRASGSRVTVTCKAPARKRGRR